jgi:hypothetical protein
LERQIDDEESLIVFGGIARNTEPQTVILEEDDSLRFKVAAHENAAFRVMTKAQREAWAKTKTLPKKFGFNQAVAAAKTTNRKAVSAALKIAVSHGLLVRDNDSYIRVGS